MSQLADLLALSLEGEAPDLYGFSGPRDILSDLHLVATNEIRTLRERWERLDADTIRARRAASRVWRLVLDAHGRKTMRKDEVRAALEGGDDA